MEDGREMAELTIHPQKAIMVKRPNSLTEGLNNSIVLTNESPTKFAVFKVLTTAPTRYGVRPTVGVIAPKQKQMVSLSVDMTDLPEDVTDLVDQFQVRVMPADVEPKEDLAELWKKTGKADYSRVKFSVAYEVDNTPIDVANASVAGSENSIKRSESAPTQKSLAKSTQLAVSPDPEPSQSLLDSASSTAAVDTVAVEAPKAIEPVASVVKKTPAQSTYQKPTAPEPAITPPSSSPHTAEIPTKIALRSSSNVNPSSVEASNGFPNPTTLSVVELGVQLNKKVKDIAELREELDRLEKLRMPPSIPDQLKSLRKHQSHQRKTEKKEENTKERCMYVYLHMHPSTSCHKINKTDPFVPHSPPAIQKDQPCIRSLFISNDHFRLLQAQPSTKNLAPVIRSFTSS